MRIVCLAAVAVLSFPVGALAESEILGRYSDWLAYNYGTGKSRGCGFVFGACRKRQDFYASGGYVIYRNGVSRQGEWS